MIIVACPQYGSSMKYLIKMTQYAQNFGSKYLKWTLEKKSHEIGFIKYGPGVKYLTNTVQ